MRCPESKLTRAHELGADPASCHTCAMQYNENYDLTIIIAQTPDDFVSVCEQIERNHRMAQNAGNN